MATFIISLVIFMLMGIIVSIIILNMQKQRKKHMMSVVRGSNYAEEAVNKKDPLKGSRRFDLANKLQDEEEEEKKKGTKIADMILQAGLEISVKEFWLFSLVSGVVLTLLVKAIGGSNFIVTMTAITGFLGLPRFILKFMIKKRQKDFMDDFADALESMMRLLQSGMPVSEAIKMVSREFTGPMGEEMGRIFDQQKIGVPLPEAALSAAKRMPLTEMQMFATAVAIQTQTGSSLSEVLENLAGVIRARYRLKRKIISMSAEAKMSAMIIGALPIVVALGLYFVNREYIEILFTDPSGKMWLTGAVFWMFCGAMVMRQMINFRV